ncbi:ABC transporter ATP-binding protein (plasmid) [Natrinema zhouii]|uniref:ABC transporter ATP-binding protein n=1 Tax=Natrinema zhouii TaxID=1710539 RepID=UPI001CFFF478|nr:ABC transporter ATP-binding protein [Natrinema zhouii]UHQ98849.1 ABC transporter ATP-binding protein [Natrinema zhouii]
MSSENVGFHSNLTEGDTANFIGENIVTGYGNHTVIHDVSVESRDGVTCIFGPNGSGKSTLINTLNGSVPTWSGTIRFGDEDLTDLAPYEIVEHGIVTLPQDGGLFPSLTVEENLKVGGHSLADSDVVAARIEDVYDSMPLLKEKQDAKAGSLSGGQQMLLSFGRATILDADIYLLDEPSAGLSPALVDDLIEMVEQLVANGSQVVLVEQNVEAALRIADYIYILAQGELKFEGTPEELSEKDRLLDVYLGIE